MSERCSYFSLGLLWYFQLVEIKLGKRDCDSSSGEV